jgi:hypothetical protein
VKETFKLTLETSEKEDMQGYFEDVISTHSAEEIT